MFPTPKMCTMDCEDCKGLIPLQSQTTIPGEPSSKVESKGSGMKCKYAIF